MAAWTETLQADHERILKAGFKVGQTGLIGKNRFVYYDTEGDHPSTVMELYDVSNGVMGFFDHLRQTAATWDGSNPIRRGR